MDATHNAQKSMMDKMSLSGDEIIGADDAKPTEKQGFFARLKSAFTSFKLPSFKMPSFKKNGLVQKIAPFVTKPFLTKKADAIAGAITNDFKTVEANNKKYTASQDNIVADAQADHIEPTIENFDLEDAKNDSPYAQDDYHLDHTAAPNVEDEPAFDTSRPNKRKAASKAQVKMDTHSLIRNYCKENGIKTTDIKSCAVDAQDKRTLIIQTHDGREGQKTYKHRALATVVKKAVERVIAHNENNAVKKNAPLLEDVVVDDAPEGEERTATQTQSAPDEPEQGQKAARPSSMNMQAFAMQGRKKAARRAAAGGMLRSKHISADAYLERAAVKQQQRISSLADAACENISGAYTIAAARVKSGKLELDLREESGALHCKMRPNTDLQGYTQSVSEEISRRRIEERSEAPDPS